MGVVASYITASAERNARRNSRTSNAKIDLLRVYGMFCIVYAHCTGHGLRLFGAAPVSSVYVIGLFIFCAGYFYRPDQDRASPLAFLRGRAKAYLLPYFLWNLVYGIVVNLMRHWGVVTYGKGLSLYTLFVSPWLDGEQFEFNYPSWFLLSLFLVVVCTWGLRRLMSLRRPMDRKKDHILLVLLTLPAIAAVYLLGQGEYHTGPEIAVLRPLTLLPFYQLGYVYRAYWEKAMDRWYWGPILAASQAALCLLNGSPFDTRMVYGYFLGDPVLLVLTAGCMVLLLSWAAGWLGKAVHGRALQYTAHCSMYIMLHHLFLLFLCHMVLWGIDRLCPLPGFSESRFHSSIWYVYTPLGRPMVLLYVAVCYMVPVLIHLGYEAILGRLALRLDRPGSKVSRSC